MYDIKISCYVAMSGCHVLDNFFLFPFFRIYLISLNVTRAIVYQLRVTILPISPPHVQLLSYLSRERGKVISNNECLAVQSYQDKFFAQFFSCFIPHGWMNFRILYE